MLISAPMIIVSQIMVEIFFIMDKFLHRKFGVNYWYFKAKAFIKPSYYIQMQAEYNLLPKRNGRSDGSFKNYGKARFFTNYFEIDFDSKKHKIYQYDFKLPPEIPQDSSLYNKAICSIKGFLKENYGYIAHKGQMFWGQKESKVATTKDVQFDEGEGGEKISHKFEALIKLTRPIDLRELDTEENRAQLLQILNIDLKNCLKGAKMMELGKNGQFYPKDQHKEEIPELRQIGLTILRGFKLTLIPLRSGLSLQIDVCSRVLQSRNLLEFIDGRSKD